MVKRRVTSDPDFQHPFSSSRFLRNPSELKSIKNISLLRQQMEAQAAAQKMSQHSQSVPFRGMSIASQQKSVFADSGADDLKCDPDDEPTDLTLDAEEKAALRMRERLERGHRFSSNGGRDEAGSERDREQLDPRPGFDFRHHIPHVSIKTENCWKIVTNKQEIIGTKF